MAGVAGAESVVASLLSGEEVGASRAFLELESHPIALRFKTASLVRKVGGISSFGRFVTS